MYNILNQAQLSYSTRLIPATVVYLHSCFTGRGVSVPLGPDPVELPIGLGPLLGLGPLISPGPLLDPGPLLGPVPTAPLLGPVPTAPLLGPVPTAPPGCPDTDRPVVGTPPAELPLGTPPCPNELDGRLPPGDWFP